MRAYLCTIGEKTTTIAGEQLQRFGFDVVVLSALESWPDKYRRFLAMANEDCIRVDADVIVNKNVELFKDIHHSYLMAQGSLFDFYRNDIFVGQPVYYSQKVFPIIRAEIDHMDMNRPETWAWRLPEIDPSTYTFEKLMGMHGFAQDRDTILRAMKHKIERKQMEHYDFELVDKILSL